MDFQILLFDIVTVFLIPYMHEIYYVPRTIPFFVDDNWNK